MNACKPVHTPLSTSEKYYVHVGTTLGPVDAINYCNIVGRLQCMTLTHPDLAFPINKVCQYLHSPTTLNLTTVKIILRFVKGTIDLGMKIIKSSWILSGFSDADWAGCLDD
jgi:hypothetical protein